MEKIELPNEKELQKFIEKLFASVGVAKEELPAIKIEIVDAGAEHKEFCESVYKTKDESKFVKFDGTYCGCYMFYYKKIKHFIKIGQVSSTNKDRYEKYHYQKKNESMSTLANSLLDFGEYDGLPSPNKKQSGQIMERPIAKWIQDNCARINILLPEADVLKLSGATKNVSKDCWENFFLNLLESALHFKYQPVFEGKCKKPKSK